MHERDRGRSSTYDNPAGLRQSATTELQQPARTAGQHAISAAAAESARRPAHELRHTGAPVAAATGATTKELMRRLGHSSPAAALLYQHAADDRDAEIARALDAMLGAATETPDEDPTWGDWSL